MLTSFFDKYTLFLFILIRMSGAIIINPIFGRRNIPNNIKVGLTIMLAATMTAYLPVPIPQITNIFEFATKGIIEFAIGFAISMVMSIFFSTIMMAAEIIDMQLGIGMAKVFDPGSNISAPVTGSFFNAFIIMLFFATNAHITFFKMLSDTVVAIPCGTDINVSGIFYAVAGLLSAALTLAIKFAFPIIAIEFISETGLGVLTRAVPNLNIFSVGIQLKVIIGFLVLFLISPVFGLFCDGLYTQMFSSAVSVLRLVTVN